MLRDLLLALNGHTGSIFKLIDGQVKVVEGLPNISSWERNALNKLLKLSTRVLFIRQFIKKYHTIIINERSNTKGLLKPGCYLRGFCKGLTNVLLPYQTKLLNVEKELLKNQNLSFLFVQQAVNDSVPLFDAINQILNEIISTKAYGCQILDVVYNATITGDENIRKAMLTILKQCHVVMYHQLSAWLLYGVLNDRHKEFFIQKKVKTDEISACEDIVQSLQNPISNFNTEGCFALCYENLPSYISHRCANIICFIGTSLNLFINEDYSSYHKSPLLDERSFDISKWHIEGLLKEKERDYLISLRELQHAEEFVLNDFEMLIDQIRLTVSRDLWTLCVDHAHLVSMFHTLKDFYLLGRGELYQTFIDEANDLLKNPPTKVTEHDVRQAFIRSATQVQIEVESFPFKLFSLIVDNNKQDVQNDAIQPFPKYENVDNGWSRLGLTFKVQWPLQTLFKDTDLEKYNQLFKFLLRVRRTQSQLQQAWMGQMNRCRNNSNEELSQLMRLQWTCRRQMQYFVDNLQYYLLADVIESQFQLLTNSVKMSDAKDRDFEVVCVAHENFLNNLLSQCFILSSKVCSCLVEILDVCQKFCEVIHTSSVLISRHDVITQLTELHDEYSDRVDIFFKLMTGISTNQCNPHITLLTLRLDYNRYFSKNNVTMVRN